ncbi:MAG: Zinc/iron permease [Candidatus Jorgensenbacteria bacterium GW2011_GWA1_48_13]|uniref:Zinc/iron permease n=2 Tax=Candidatus Joergenseniibacteriota TaxID=1752739 RepID=A0A0G1Z8J6_9BACT|nr:MAG: Zinc/iron permease [Candidatus Jorgensenbacteria bacterium GW2011_GWA1_48_13]KKU98816.1 MAG: divalent heavy-metal cations transporter [Candidatus Jorgensenbacteria bacterium GW2011_GWC1_48_8]KKW15349.1 MAG: Zinc/iron permease [Candidatus Jorgensenbacteria bacterium GW2011_GWB1_50_10]
MFLQILTASLIGSVFALVGGVLLLAKERLARSLSLLLVSFAVGSLMGAAFFDLIPEALAEAGGTGNIFVFVVLGILVLFVFEKFLRWYHCHDRETCDLHTFSSAVLFGDAIHNFIDGIIIALSFSLGVPVGVAATIAIFFHEVPQEIGDFGVLLHAGYTKTKVLLYNFFTALTTPVGAILGYLALPLLNGVIPYLTAFASGIFIYIAVSDLMPEIHHKTRPQEFTHFLLILIGLALLWFIGVIFPE